MTRQTHGERDEISETRRDQASFSFDVSACRRSSIIRAPVAASVISVLRDARVRATH
jgi:hypothetical protein